MSPRRKGVLLLAGIGILGVALIGVLSLQRHPEEPRVAPPSTEASARIKLQEALRDASLLDLIRNARVAARKGDAVTHDAMVTGLRREPHRARTLIKGELSKSNDTSDVAILNRMMQELP